MDWLLTVPLLLMELVFVMKFNQKEAQLKSATLGVAAALMIMIGYPGELITEGPQLSSRWMFWGMSMMPFCWIVHTLLVGLKAATDAEENQSVADLIRLAQKMTVVSWCTYPIVYIIPMLGASGSGAVVGIQIGYCISDIISKCGVGLLTYNIAKTKSQFIVNMDLKSRGGGRTDVAPPPMQRQQTWRMGGHDGPETTNKWLAHGVTHYLPLALIVALLVGLIIPAPGRMLGDIRVGPQGQYLLLPMLLVMTMFIINGLCMDTGEAKRAITNWKPLAYASTAILVVTPFVALGLLKLPKSMGMEQAFVTGFIIFNCMPTTLSSGVTIVRQARGDAMLAIVITSLTNIVGVFTAPILLAFMLSSYDIKLEAMPLLFKLGLTVILPLGIGKLIREKVPQTKQKLDDPHFKVGINVVQQSCTVLIVWMKLSKGSDVIIATPNVDLALVLFTSLLIHGSFLVLNFIVAGKLLTFHEYERKSLILLGSQKAFPVAMAVITFIDPAIVTGGKLGLLVIPCICSHFVQLLWGSAIASYWSSHTSEETDPSRIDPTF